MRARLVALLAGALIAVSAIGVASASAASEFGDSCLANRLSYTSPPITLFDVSAPADPLPITAPSAGVITKWKVNLVPVPISFPQTLKVLHPNGGDTVQIVGDATGSITGGLNTFDTRIPVQTGDRVGLFGSTTVVGSEEIGNLFCETGEANVIGGTLGSATVGSTETFVQEPSAVRVPVSAVVEPDADNDGYGDETQDKCPTSAATQAACPAPAPPVTLSTSSIAKKGLATVLITSNAQAPVTVAGTVKLGKGKTASLSGGTQIVVPGAIAKFTLLFTAKLKAKLKGLSPKQSLTLNLAATAPNAAGAISTSSLTAKLKGQAEPKHHKKPKH